MKIKNQMRKSGSMKCIMPNSTLSSNKEQFVKINSVKATNEEGIGSIVLFKKPIKIPTIFDIVLKDSGYITDGGLKKKLQRFKVNTTFFKTGLGMIWTPRHKQNQSNEGFANKNILNHSMKDIQKKNMPQFKSNSLVSPKANNRSRLNKNTKLLIKNTNKKYNNKSNDETQSNNSSKHRRCLSPDVKIAKMEKLVEKALKTTIRQYSMSQLKKTQHEKLKEKKQKYLEENGIVFNDNDLNDEEYKESKFKSEEEKLNKPKKNQFTYKTNSLLNTLSLKEKLSKTLSFREVKEEKRTLKPKVDQFEYMKKIKKEIKRISNDFHNHPVKNINFNNSFCKSNHNKEFSLINGNENIQHNSSYINDKSNLLSNNKMIRRSLNNSQSLNLLSYSNNYSAKELEDYTLTKRIQQKEIEENQLKQNNQKLFMIYRNLFNLSQKLQFKPKKKPKKTNRILNILTDKKKQLNSYAISTVFDRNDYYNSVLNSKQVLQKTRSDFEKQKKKQKLFNRNQMNQDSSIPKLTNKIHNYIDSTNNNNQSTAQFSELQQKIIQTILKTNNILSKENYEQLVSLDKGTNSSFQEKTMTKKKNCNNKHKNIIIKEENYKRPSAPLSKQVISIDNNTTNLNETKENNLPSLSHNYTINNTITNNKRIIEPRVILNLVTIVKLLIQRKIFYMFYEDYFNEAMVQRYTIAFIYFNALVKHRTFHQLVCYSNSKFEYFSICQLFKPFIKSCFRGFKVKLQSFGKVKLFCKLLLQVFTIRNKRRSRHQILIEAFQKFKQNVNKIERYQMINVTQTHYIIQDERLSTISSRNSHDKNERKYAKYKMNTYLYESFSMKSEYTIKPNSVDSHKLHRLHMMMQQNDILINEGLMLENDLNDYNLQKYYNNRIDSNNSNNYNSYYSILNKNSRNNDALTRKKSLHSSESNESRENKAKTSRKGKDDTQSLNVIKRRDDLSFLNDFNQEKNDRDENESNTFCNIKCEVEEKEIKLYNINKHVIKDDNCNDSNYFQINKKENIKDKYSMNTEEDILAEDDQNDDIEWSHHLATKELINDESINHLNFDDKIENGLNEQSILFHEHSKEMGKNSHQGNTRYDETKLNEKVKNKDSTNTVICLTPSKDNNGAIDNDYEPNSSFNNGNVHNCLEDMNLDQETDNLIEEIVSQIIRSEIVNNNLIPSKKFKYDSIVNNSNSLNLSLSFNNQSLNLLNDASLMQNYTSFSIFSRTIKDKKKDQSLNIYLQDIFPALLDCIKKEIKANYHRIYNNLIIPIKSNPPGLMASLTLEDADMLRDNYKRLIIKREDFELLNKDSIVNEFRTVNKAIREKDNLSNSTSSDELLNECIIDTVIELLNKKRLYEESGEPLPWGSRKRQLAFNYPKNNSTKLIYQIEKELVSIIHLKMGIISENYDYVDPDILNIEREKRLISNILNELNEEDEHWTNLEMEETQVKLETNELILNQLYNEVIKIIEHIYQCRKNPKLYQYKSIYSCEEIPKLTLESPVLVNVKEEEEDEEGNNVMII